MRILITGATGLLGSNTLLEWIKNYLLNLDDLEIIVLGRSKKEQSLESRIKDIVLGTEGVSYLGSSINFKEIEVFLKRNVKYVKYDLRFPGLGISDDYKKALRRFPIDFFIHEGASTDLRLGASISEISQIINVSGTQKILELINQLLVKEFVYVGTAYSCGDVSGDVDPDFINRTDEFRNSYERTKLEAELLVREYAEKKGLKYRIFRPSVICGRLMESPFGAINKFDVIYGWGAFFLKLKLKTLKMSFESGLKTNYQMDVRICFRKEGGLNIVPADYAAKLMFQVCVQNLPGKNFYLVNPIETPHDRYLLGMIKAFNINGVRWVSNIPNDQNRIEEFYYKTVGRIFTPYINATPNRFNDKNLRVMTKRQGLICPEISDINLKKLISYALTKRFGL